MMSDFASHPIDTQDTETVAEAIDLIYGGLFEDAEPGFISGHIHAVEGMFAGRYRHYQPADTQYHDLEHTFQASLCLVDLLKNFILSGDQPHLSHDDFRIGFLAMLLHDTGYLKEQGDLEGTGAKYTYSHEKRSCRLAYGYLTGCGWPEDHCRAVQRLISCTGPRAQLAQIPFKNTAERFLGYAVCTSDYLGQMSDPGYVEKLPKLFLEFQESDNYCKTPSEERLFKNETELYEKTPDFWRECVIPKLTDHCGNVWRYLAFPYPHGPNTYRLRVEENINRIASVIKA